MSELIPDVAVEAAARAAFFEDCGSTSVDLTDDERAVWDDGVRVVLKAAAPYIAAQVLREVMAAPGGVRAKQRTDYGYMEETVYPRDVLAQRAAAYEQEARDE